MKEAEPIEKEKEKVDGTGSTETTSYASTDPFLDIPTPGEDRFSNRRQKKSKISNEIRYLMDTLPSWYGM